MGVHCHEEGSLDVSLMDGWDILLGGWRVGCTSRMLSHEGRAVGLYGEVGLRMNALYVCMLSCPVPSPPIEE